MASRVWTNEKRMTDRIDEPQNERSRRTRAAVLDAAWKILESEGTQGATMGAIARRAGVSRGALYLHFSSRAELLMALYDHVDEALDLAASLQPVRDAKGAVEALDAFAEHVARYHSRCLTIDIAVDRARHTDPDVDALYRRGIQSWLDGCQRRTEQLQQEGRLAPPWTVESARDQLFAFMSPYYIHTLMEVCGWSVDDLAASLKLVWRRTLVSPP